MAIFLNWTMIGSQSDENKSPSLSGWGELKCDLKQWLLTQPLVSIITMFPKCKRVPVVVIIFGNHSLFQMGRKWYRGQLISGHWAVIKSRCYCCCVVDPAGSRTVCNSGSRPRLSLEPGVAGSIPALATCVYIIMHLQPEMNSNFVMIQAGVNLRPFYNAKCPP